MASLAEKRIADDEDRSDDPQARPEELRLLEALLFASTEPLDQAALAKRMPDGVDIKVALAQLQADYAARDSRRVSVLSRVISHDRSPAVRKVHLLATRTRLTPREA